MFTEKEFFEKIIAIDHKFQAVPLEQIVAKDNRNALKAIMKIAEKGKFLTDFLLLEGKNKKTILHLAISKQNIDMVNDIIQAIAIEDIERIILAQDKHKNSALHWAVAVNNPAIVKTLLTTAQHIGNDLLKKMLLAQDSSGNTPLYLALFDNEDEVIQDILDKVLSNSSLAIEVLTKANIYGSSPIQFIVSDDKYQKILSRIISKAIELNIIGELRNFKNKDGKDILEIAKAAKATAISELIEREINQYQPDPTSVTNTLTPAINQATSSSAPQPSLQNEENPTTLEIKGNLIHPEVQGNILNNSITPTTTLSGSWPTISSGQPTTVTYAVASNENNFPTIGEIDEKVILPEAQGNILNSSIANTPTPSVFPITSPSVKDTAASNETNLKAAQQIDITLLETISSIPTSSVVNIPTLPTSQVTISSGQSNEINTQAAEPVYNERSVPNSTIKPYHIDIQGLSPAIVAGWTCSSDYANSALKRLTEENLWISKIYLSKELTLLEWLEPDETLLIYVATAHHLPKFFSGLAWLLGYDLKTDQNDVLAGLFNYLAPMVEFGSTMVMTWATKDPIPLMVYIAQMPAVQKFLQDNLGTGIYDFGSTVISLDMLAYYGLASAPGALPLLTIESVSSAFTYAVNYDWISSQNPVAVYGKPGLEWASELVHAYSYGDFMVDIYLLKPLSNMLGESCQAIVTTLDSYIDFYS